MPGYPLLKGRALRASLGPVPARYAPFEQEGEGRLDLICNTISLETQEVQSRVYHPISLIQLDYLPEGPVREMLSAYAVLQERLGDLGLISA